VGSVADDASTLQEAFISSFICIFGSLILKFILKSKVCNSTDLWGTTFVC
jgi:hypothetical protein